MKFCKNCGKPLEEDQSYCTNCGKIVDQDRFITESSTIAEENKSPYEASEPINNIERNDNSEKGDEQPALLIQNESQKYTHYEDEQPPLNNWIKVLLSVLVPGIPGLGAIIGIVASLIFMSNNDTDRRSFGQALLTFSILFILIFCSCVFLFYFAAQEAMSEVQNFYYNY